MNENGVPIFLVAITAFLAAVQFIKTSKNLVPIYFDTFIFFSFFLFLCCYFRLALRCFVWWFLFLALVSYVTSETSVNLNFILFNQASSLID